ncbi:hypothetical protein [Mycobacterium asiaticum]|nr:hypothetical protein [Mycobacterium asiaticum]
MTLFLSLARILTFPLSFFDFEAFNRAADDLWNRTTAAAAEGGRS